MKLKASTWKDIIVIVICIVVLYFFCYPTIKDFIARRNIETANLNLNFIGQDKGSYGFSKACELEDGSILIASALLNKPGTVTLIKLTPQLKLLWEQKLTDSSKLMKARNRKSRSTLRIADFKVSGNKCMIYAIQEMNGTYTPSFISTDMNGNLLRYLTIPHGVFSKTQAQGILIGKSAYFSWFDNDNKLINIYKLHWDDPSYISKQFIYLIQNKLRYTSIFADSSSHKVFITTYDSIKGSSLLSYKDETGLMILNDTDKYQTMQLVSAFESRLYVIATKDSSLAIGIINSDREPDIVLSYKYSSNNFIPRALVKKDSTFIIGINDINTKTSKENEDVVILKINSHNLKTGEYHISGKGDDKLNQLLVCTNGDLLAIGNSDSHKFGMGSRVFATKFRP